MPTSPRPGTSSSSPVSRGLFTKSIWQMFVGRWCLRSRSLGERVYKASECELECVCDSQQTRVNPFFRAPFFLAIRSLVWLLSNKPLTFRVVRKLYISAASLSAWAPVPFQGPHGQTHTHKPRRGVRGWRSQTQRQHTLADAGVLSSTTLVGSLSLPAQLYRAWPAPAVAWPFTLRSPASPDASVAPTTWCPPQPTLTIQPGRVHVTSSIHTDHCARST
jgi:hypothetical protein